MAQMRGVRMTTEPNPELLSLNADDGELRSLDGATTRSPMTLSQRSDIRQVRENEWEEFCVTHRIGGREPGWSLADGVMERLKAL